MDLLKGYWQVPLTDRAKQLSAFVTLDGLYQYQVMHFGMKNVPATFQRMINKLVGRMEGCEVYIDDVVVYSDCWNVIRLRSVLTKFAVVNLTVNLAKSAFGHANSPFQAMWLVGVGSSHKVSKFNLYLNILHHQNLIGKNS